MAQVVDCLSSKGESLSSNPLDAKGRERERARKPRSSMNEFNAEISLCGN
jgi:hypothetical protein